MKTPAFQNLTNFCEFSVLMTTVNGKTVTILPHPDLQLDIASFQVYNIKTGQICEEITNAAERIEILFDRGVVECGNGSGSVQIQGTIPVLTDWRRFPRPDLDVTNHINCQEQMNEWLVEMGTPEGSDYWIKYHNSRIPLLVAVFTPGVLLEEQFANVILMYLFIVLDDIFDNYKDLWKAGIPSRDLIEAVDAFCSICLGERYDEGIGSYTQFPHFSFICKYFQKFRDCLETIGIEKCEVLVKTTVDCLECNAWENRGWTGSLSGDPLEDERFYFFRRESTYGWLPLVEFVCAVKDIIIPDRVRRDPLLDFLRRRWVRASLLINDMFSIQKEIHNGEESNIILVRSKRMSAVNALERAILDFQNSVQEIDLVHKKLEIKYQKHQDISGLKTYMDLGKAIFDGNNQFMLSVKRYGIYPFKANLYI